MVAEFGSLAVGGERAEWYGQARASIVRYLEARAVLFSHVSDDQTVTRQGIDWSLLDDPSTLAAVREAVSTLGLELPATAPPYP
jgi:hypothetical protein